MKRLLLLVILMTLLVTSCQDGDLSSKLPNLSKTVWAANGDSGSPSNYRQVLNFYDGVNVAYYTYYTNLGQSIESIPSSAVRGTYSVVSKDEVSFNLIRSYSFGAIQVNVVYEKGRLRMDGSEMTVYLNSGGNPISYQFVKQ